MIVRSAQVVEGSGKTLASGRVLAQVSPTLSGRSPVGSVVIPAHNEASVIEGCLAGLFDGSVLAEFEVVVSCNGCTDGTADLVRSLPYPVRLLETDQASKPAALRAADSACTSFPRLYVDADVRLRAQSVVATLDRLRTHRAVAARPPAQYDTTYASPLVRRFYRARAHIPALHRSLWGAGVYGMSAAGRARFGEFPDVVADDLFVDRLFDPEEKEVVACEPVTVTAAGGTADFLQMLRRSYRGKAEADHGGRDPGEGTLITVRQVARYGLRGPNQMLDAVVYLSMAVAARVAYRVNSRVRWERDESSRSGRDVATARDGS